MRISSLLNCFCLVLCTDWILSVIAFKTLKDLNIFHNQEAVKGQLDRHPRCVQCGEERYGGDGRDYPKRGDWFSSREGYYAPADVSTNRGSSSEGTYSPYRNPDNTRRIQGDIEYDYAYNGKPRDDDYYQRPGNRLIDRGNEFGQQEHPSYVLDPYTYRNYYGNNEGFDQYQYGRRGGETYRDYYPDGYDRHLNYDYHQQDDTFRGISETDISGRGYYYASDDERRSSAPRYPIWQQYPSSIPYGSQRNPISKDLPVHRPKIHICEIHVEKCPENDRISPSSIPYPRLPSLPTAKSQVIYSSGHRGSGISVTGTLDNFAGWSYVENGENEEKKGLEDLAKDPKAERNQQSS